MRSSILGSSVLIFVDDYRYLTLSLFELSPTQLGNSITMSDVDVEDPIDSDVVIEEPEDAGENEEEEVVPQGEEEEEEEEQDDDDDDDAEVRGA